AAVAGQKRKRDRDQRHHPREQGQRELAIKTNLERESIDAAALQFADIVGQLPEVHLLVLQNLLQEIIRPLIDFRERRRLLGEVLELLLAPSEIAAPTIFKNPRA